MVIARILRFLAISSAMGAIACERPTGPELVEKIERADRALHSGSPDTNRLNAWFAGSWNYIRLLPNAQAEPDLRAEIGGKQHTFEAFVFERIVIPGNAQDGYPCARVYRSLLAAEGGREGFELRGSDFSKPVSEDPYCAGRYSGSGMNFSGSPYIRIAGSNESSIGLVGVSGNARIDVVGSAGQCSFLKIDANAEFKVDCDLRTYVVSANAMLAVPKNDNSSSLIRTQRRFALPQQRVPGFRLIIHCNEKTTSFGGCEPMSGVSY
jgi:hypothetical protein